MTKSLLIVDDNPEFLRGIALRLEGVGHIILTATATDNALVQATHAKTMLSGLITSLSTHQNDDGRVQMIHYIRRLRPDLPVLVYRVNIKEEKFLQMLKKLDHITIIDKAGRNSILETDKWIASL